MCTMYVSSVKCKVCGNKWTAGSTGKATCRDYDDSLAKAAPGTEEVPCPAGVLFAVETPGEAPRCTKCCPPAID